VNIKYLIVDFQKKNVVRVMKKRYSKNKLKREVGNNFERLLASDVT
jgi:hypothetical protein